MTRDWTAPLLRALAARRWVQEVRAVVAEAERACEEGAEVSGWLCDRLPNGEVHVVPVGDLHEHAATDCACGPTTEAVFDDDGSNGWLVTHHSLDGREQWEDR